MSIHQVLILSLSSFGNLHVDHVNDSLSVHVRQKEVIDGDDERKSVYESNEVRMVQEYKETCFAIKDGCLQQTTCIGQTIERMTCAATRRAVTTSLAQMIHSKVRWLSLSSASSLR